jgi:sigma-B regulation protein RsbU (phosphoserine phosphatase)
LSRVLIICDELDSAWAHGLAAEVFVGWGQEHKPTLREMRWEELAALHGKHPDVDTAWLFVGGATPRNVMHQALDAIEEWRCPALLTRAGEGLPIGSNMRDGVVIAPAEAGAEKLRVMLCALISQGAVIRGMKQEIEIVRRQHDGMAGEMDKLDEELRLAARLQRQFLPQRMPEMPGVRFDVLFRPATYVSGDIYDVQQLGKDLSSFYVADAVGHGVPAALLTMLIKQSLQGREGGLRNAPIVPPDEAMRRLNRDLMQRQSSQVQPVTACYGHYDCRTHELQLVRAGHPPPYLMKADGRLETLCPDGALLGVFDDEKFEVLRVQVEPGDRLLIYSDGFELAFADSANPRDARYLRELQDLRGGTLKEAMARLHEKLDHETGSLHQRDDLTAMVMDVSLVGDEVNVPVTSNEAAD